ncbi:MAG: PmoA family protein [Chloroflexi bacterium]|nr:PmoA family protein [Chloroflexota bacterium]
MSTTRFVVQAGRHTRKQVPLAIPVDGAGSAPLAVRNERTGETLPAQQCAEGIAFILPELGAGVEETFSIVSIPVSAGGVTVKEHREELEIALEGALVTRYRFAGEGLARPYFWPVIGPGGMEVTRAYPIIPDRPGETRDHPHHRSLWVSYGELDGIDAWSEAPGHGRTLHDRFEAVTSGPVFGGFVESTRWVDSVGRELLREQRELRLYRVSGDLRVLDLTLNWTFERKDERGRRYSLGQVHLGDTKEAGLIAVRVATSMDAKVDGRIENAWGGISEAETWGKRAPWCDYSGPVGGEIAGIAAFDHPGNLHFPCYWHVRNYGLMGANPFSGENFTGNPLENGAMTFRPGDQLRFRYRVVLHQGNASAAHVGERWFDFGFPPTITVTPK